MLIKTRRVTATPRPIAKAVNLWGPSVIWEPSASTKLVHFNVEVSVGQVSEVAQVVVVELGRAVVAEEDDDLLLPDTSTEVIWRDTECNFEPVCKT